MKRLTSLIAVLMMSGLLIACGTSKSAKLETQPQPGDAVPRNVKIRVVDVSNKTGELFDVDIIGLLWSGLDESLRKRDLLWKGGPSSPAPLRLEAQVVKFQKGSFFLRPVLPFLGKTVLGVRCDLKDGDRVVESVEAKETISYGSGVFTTEAWRKIFAQVSEDVITQLSRKL